MDTAYFTINHLLTYNRRFIFVNAVRGIGKTYGAYYHFIKDWIKNRRQFVAICRTKDEKKANYLQKAVDKVIQKEFPELYTATDSKGKQLLTVTKDTLEYDGQIIGYCIALSEYVKIKKDSYPNVYWILFDEYCIEEDNPTVRYVNGWSEPDMLLSIYHTIDREEDRVTCIFMANNISAYNPYHLHKAFKIPYVAPGKMWTDKNVVFENAIPSAELKETKSKCRFLEMVKDTEYGNMAVDGNYIYDNDDMISNISLDRCKPIVTIVYNNEKFGIWRCLDNPFLIVSLKINPTFTSVLACTPSDMADGRTLLSRRHPRISYFATCFKMGYVRFMDMEAKKRFVSVMPYII